MIICDIGELIRKGLKDGIVCGIFGFIVAFSLFISIQFRYTNLLIF